MVDTYLLRVGTDIRIFSGGAGRPKNSSGVQHAFFSKFGPVDTDSGAASAPSGWGRHPPPPAAPCPTFSRHASGYRISPCFATRTASRGKNILRLGGKTRAQKKPACVRHNLCVQVRSPPPLPGSALLLARRSAACTDGSGDRSSPHATLSQTIRTGQISSTQPYIAMPEGMNAYSSQLPPTTITT